MTFFFCLAYILKQFKHPHDLHPKQNEQQKGANETSQTNRALTRSSDRTHLGGRATGPAVARLTAALSPGEPPRQLLRTAATRSAGETAACSLIWQSS